VLEAVGTSSSVSGAIPLVRPAGTLVLMGNPAGDIMLSQDIYWRILRKQLHIFGTWNSAYEHDGPSDWSVVRDALVAGEIQADCLISHTFSQRELDKGLGIMFEHKEPYCKVMTLWNEEM
jgi:L-iditol 2-dehydrogenase